MMKKLVKQLSPALLLSLATGFMLCVFAPLELYFYNKYEFWFDFEVLFPVCMLMFGIYAVISMAIMCGLYGINRKWYNGAVILYLIAFLATYVQGNFLVGNLPHLDGSAIDWSKYDIQRIYSILLWVVLAGLVGLAIKKCSAAKVVKAAAGIAGAFLLMLLITLVTAGMMYNGTEKKLNMSNTMNYALEMSTDRNLVVIVLDAVDGETMSGLIDSHPEYADIFADFTYYDNTMSAYPYTLYALPYIFSGEWYENQEDYMEYAKRIYRTSPFFAQLEERGYRLGLYEPEAFLLDESMFRFENIVNTMGELSSVKDLMILELKMMGFKYMPYDLKRFCVAIPAEIAELRTFNDAETGVPCTGYAIPIYDYLKNTDVTLTDEKCFRYFHFEGGHEPWHLDAQVNEIGEGTYEQNVEAGITVVAAYLDKLKESGVYDNSAIMILSDHGYNPERGDTDSLGRQHSILFVKGIGEQHDALQISGAPLSHTDLQEAYARLLDGKTGGEVFDYREGDARERRYLYYEYDDNTFFTEYMQTGEAGNEDTMIFTGVEIRP